MEADGGAAAAGGTLRSGTEKKLEELRSPSSAAVLNTVALASEMRNMHLTVLDEKTKGFLADAEKRFRKARENATDAFNNEAPSTLDCVTAIRYRVMATILESVVETLRSSSDLSSLSLKLALERTHQSAKNAFRLLTLCQMLRTTLKWSSREVF